MRCPYCAELILRIAKKCRHCGEDVDPRSRMAKARSQQRGSDGGAGDIGPDAVDWILCFVCPGIACILGVFALLRGQSKRGGIMIGVSLVWGLIVGVIRSASAPHYSRY